YTAVTDHSNNLWLGTEGGGISILNLSPALFETFPSQTVTRRESALLMVKALYHRKGYIYIGTYEKGLYKVNRFTRKHEVLFDPVKRKDTGFHGIFFIKEDNQKRIWMNLGSRIGIIDP